MLSWVYTFGGPHCLERASQLLQDRLSLALQPHFLPPSPAPSQDPLTVPQISLHPETSVPSSTMLLPLPETPLPRLHRASAYSSHSMYRRVPSPPSPSLLGGSLSCHSL